MLSSLIVLNYFQQSICLFCKKNVYFLWQWHYLQTNMLKLIGFKLCGVLLAIMFYYYMYISCLFVEYFCNISFIIYTHIFQIIDAGIVICDKDNC